MLRELRIHNLAIIDEIQLSFDAGMNVLSGETGGGKSIIMRAIGLLCGARATPDLLRTDADEAAIEGLFELSESDRGALTEAGLDPDGEVLVRRVISRSGKGKVYINGGLATTGLLAQLGSRLIHVYGQNEQALLLKPESHVDYLDEFGKLGSLRARSAESWACARAAEAHLGRLLESGESARQRLDLLQFQLHELRDANVATGEEAQLQREREVQRHAERLSQTCLQGEEALYSGEQAIAAALGRTLNQLQEAARIDPTFNETIELLRSAATNIDEAALQLRRAGGRLEHDPARLIEIEERLALLSRLKRKYGCDGDGLAAKLAGFENELSVLETAGFDVASARASAEAAAAAAWKIARQLTQERSRAAAQLEKKVAQELAAVGMRGAVFRVVFAAAAASPAETTTAGLSASGADQIEFYLSANPGEDPKPLARIASGGELSRIMLALKTLTAGAGEVPTLIFDEVDAGIGGAVAEAVGQRLRALAASRQILCITHLPQIAAQADHHFAVEKRVTKGRTRSTARVLDADERVAEIARMLGSEATAESQQYARKLVQATARHGRGS